MKKKLAAETSAFAHLLATTAGLATRRGRAAAENDQPDDPEGDDEDKDADPDAEVDDTAVDDDGDDKKTGKKAKRAKGKAKSEDDDTDPDAEVDDPEDESCEDEADDEEMAAARTAGWRAQQTRCRRIFGSSAAGTRPDMAAHLAFNETMPSAKAIEMLELAASGTAPRNARLHDRMSRVVTPLVSPNGVRRSCEEASFGELVAAAVAKVRK